MVARISDDDDDHRNDDAVEKDRHFQFSGRRAGTDFLEQQSASCRVFVGGKAERMNRQRGPIAASRYQWLANLSLRDRKQNPYPVLGE